MRLTPRLAHFAALAAVLCLGGCDRQRISELEEGVSTEADVRTRFGQPENIWDAPGGRVFEYNRQPQGQKNYMITIGPDGKMSALRQVLTPASFARVMPGLERSQVRRLLGRPARTQAYALKQEEVWDWRFLDGNESKVFSVTFDKNGRVASTATLLDPQQLYSGR